MTSSGTFRFAIFPLLLLVLACDAQAPAQAVPGSGQGSGQGSGKGTGQGAGQGSGHGGGKNAAADVAASADTLRLSSVKTPLDGGLYDLLIPAFVIRSGLKVVVMPGEDVYGPARRGTADVVLSHYGHEDTRAFVLDGYGEWPRAVFSNQIALVGPPADPAGIRGMQSVTAAFRRIADTRSPFLVNNMEGIKYLTDILWNAAGRPDKKDWYLESDASKRDALVAAVDRGAYTLWGVTPFLREQRAAPLKLEPMVLHDPLLQRLMVTVVVSPDKVPGVNHAAALAFQKFLVAPETQAMIRNFRLPGLSTGIWWPAGRYNTMEP